MYFMECYQIVLVKITCVFFIRNIYPNQVQFAKRDDENTLLKIHRAKLIQLFTERAVNQ